MPGLVVLVVVVAPVLGCRRPLRCLQPGVLPPRVHLHQNARRRQVVARLPEQESAVESSNRGGGRRVAGGRGRMGRRGRRTWRDWRRGRRGWRGPWCGPGVLPEVEHRVATRVAQVEVYDRAEPAVRWFLGVIAAHDGDGVARSTHLPGDAVDARFVREAGANALIDGRLLTAIAVECFGAVAWVAVGCFVPAPRRWRARRRRRRRERRRRRRRTRRRPRLGRRRRLPFRPRRREPMRLVHRGVELMVRCFLAVRAGERVELPEVLVGPSGEEADGGRREHEDQGGAPLKAPQHTAVRTLTQLRSRTAEALLREHAPTIHDPASPHPGPVRVLLVFRAGVAIAIGRGQRGELLEHCASRREI